LLTVLFNVLMVLIRLYIWAVILGAVFSMLLAFGVLDSRNRLVWSIGDFLYRITEPALRPIRRFLPNFGGIDISPMILIVLLWALQQVLERVYAALAYGTWQTLVL
jgi:YggT family protein